MEEAKSKICPWCGKLFYGVKKEKYCDKVCYYEVQAAVNLAKKHGQDSTSAAIIDKHKEQLRAEETKKRYINTLAPVHISSSSVQWRVIKKRRVGE